MFKFSNEMTAIAKNESVMYAGEKNARNVMRKGKTERDRKKNAGNRNASNKMKRADWENDGGKSPFPRETCGGKRYRAPSFKAARKAGNRKRK